MSFFQAWFPLMAYVLVYWFADGNMYSPHFVRGYVAFQPQPFFRGRRVTPRPFASPGMGFAPSGWPSGCITNIRVLA